MIEIDFDTSLQAIREEIIPQMPYKDDYSTSSKSSSQRGYSHHIVIQS